jgi:uroporphyrinogen decarboxylase
MMTGKERVSNIFNRKPVDRIGAHEHFWNDTRVKWERDGLIKEGQTFAEHFNFDIELSTDNFTSVFNMIADLDFVPVLLEETEDTILHLDGNQAKLRWHKKHDGTPEHVGFTVTDGESYRNILRPFILQVDERRIDAELYQRLKANCDRDQRFYIHSCLAPFECMHLASGHENLLVAMLLEPEWVQEMAMDYAKLTVSLMEIMFSKYGKPDGVYFYEDLGFKQRPFMSPELYIKCLQPAHKYLTGFAHSQGLPVMMHSCGFIEMLLPHMIDAGINALDVMEIKAGMDPVKLTKEYGDVISFMGGVDVRSLYSNDKKIIDAELESKIPFFKENCGYVLHSDHSIPMSVEYDTYVYFLEKGLKLGTF